MADSAIVDAVLFYMAKMQCLVKAENIESLKRF